MAEVKNYPPYLDYPKESKPQTNGDRIRAKISTNEKLAKVIMDCGIDECLSFCKELPECEACDYDAENPAVDCMRCLVEWLGQPAEVQYEN